MYPRNSVGVSFNSDTVWQWESMTERLMADRIPGSWKVKRGQFLCAWCLERTHSCLALGLPRGFGKICWGGRKSLEKILLQGGQVLGDELGKWVTRVCCRALS